MAGATDEALWRIAVGLEERGVFQQRLPSPEEYRRDIDVVLRRMTGTHLTFLQQVKAALRTAEEFSRLINNQANSSQHAIPEFLLNFRVRALLSDQILAESLFPGRAPFLSAVSSPVKKAEDEYDAPAEQAQRPPGPPVAKFPLDDMYYTLEENHEDWVHNHEQLLHARDRPPVVQQVAPQTIKVEPPPEVAPAPQPPAPTPPAPPAAAKESPEAMVVDQGADVSVSESKKEGKEQTTRGDPSSESRRAEKQEDDEDEDEDSDDDDGEDKGRRKRDRGSKGESNKSSRELRNLLSDVKLAKKWAGCTIPNQAELYEALDNVLKQARDLKDYSYPFLRPVRRADAPDYYRRIKTPMDFKTMAKKLRKAEYNSKKEFQADLTLIYSNCRKYNTDADSPFRQCADEVESLTKKLMQEVPAIDITQARKEAALKASTEEQPAVPAPESPKSPSSEDEPPKKKPKGRRGGATKEEESPQVSKDSSSAQPETPAAAAAATGRGKARRSDGSTGQPSPAPPPKEDQAAKAQREAQLREAEAKRAEEAKKAAADAAARKAAEQKKEEELRKARAQPERLIDQQLRMWREITREERVKYMNYRMHQNSLPFSERDALVRSADGMAAYATAVNTATRANTGLGFFPEYSHPASCMPDLPQPASSNPTRQYPNFTENNAMMRNTQRLAHIRDLRNRLLPDLGDGPAPPEEPLPSPNSAAAPSHYTEKLNTAILRKSLVLLLAHAGFQSSSRNAMDVLTDVVQQFYRKLCRILRLRLQEPLPTGDAEDPIHLALVEMGASGYQALRQHYLSSVVQYGRRLTDLETRLQSHVERAAQFATAEAAPEEELEEDDVAFLSGAFGEGVQLDVLGLSELGIDGSAVPAHLLAPGAAQRKRKVVAAKPSPAAPETGSVPQTPAEEAAADAEEEGEEGDEDDEEDSYDEDEDDDRKRKHLSSGFLPQKKTRPDEGLLT